MEVMLSGRVISVNEVQFLNALSPIEVIFSEKVTLDNLVQSLNALFFIWVILN